MLENVAATNLPQFKVDKKTCTRKYKCRYEKYYLRNDKVDENNKISDNPTAPW